MATLADLPLGAIILIPVGTEENRQCEVADKITSYPEAQCWYTKCIRRIGVWKLDPIPGRNTG